MQSILDWWLRVEEPLFYVEVPRNITILEMKTKSVCSESGKFVYPSLTLAKTVNFSAKKAWIDPRVTI
jgi:hypothetical protein